MNVLIQVVQIFLSILSFLTRSFLMVFISMLGLQRRFYQHLTWVLILSVVLLSILSWLYSRKVPFVYDQLRLISVSLLRLQFFDVSLFLNFKRCLVFLLYFWSQLHKREYAHFGHYFYQRRERTIDSEEISPNPNKISDANPLNFIFPPYVL